MQAPSAPVDVAVSLIAHAAVPPVRAAQARRAAEWMLGGPTTWHTPAQRAADLAVRLCRTLAAPASLRAAADLLGGVALADAAWVSEQLRDRGLTRDLVTVHGLLRVLRLWGMPVDGLQLRTIEGRTVAIGTAGSALLADLSAALRVSRGPVQLRGAPTMDPDVAELAAVTLGAGLTAGWLYPISSAPPTSGLGYLTTRLLRVNPQTIADIAAAANNRHVLGRGVQRPPPHVLRSWLTDQPWIEVDDHGVIRLAAGVQRGGHRLDDAITAALRAHPTRPTTAAELRQAILDAGYAPSGLRFLMGASPIPERVSARRNSGYRLRGPQPTATRPVGISLITRSAAQPGRRSWYTPNIIDTKATATASQSE